MTKVQQAYKVRRNKWQVHDELVFEIHEDDINQEVKNIVNIMQDCVSLDLPLEVNYGIEDNWGDAH